VRNGELILLVVKIAPRGEACGVTRQMLAMIEHGKAKPSADLLSKLAGTLGCDMDDLHA
jgi:transcriptional regulator with XRE-family HTH domain